MKGVHTHEANGQDPAFRARISANLPDRQLEAASGARATARPPQSSLALAQVWAGKWGFPIFPLEAGSKDATGCFFLEPFASTVDPKIIQRLWGSPDGAGQYKNIAWRTGKTPASDTILIDVDVKDGRRGVETLLGAARKAGLPIRNDEDGLADLGALTGALVVRTASGGYHFVWSGAGQPDMSQRNALWREEFGADCGIDVRARHGYAVGPGSVTEAGAYRIALEPPGGRLGACPWWVAKRLIPWAQGQRGGLTVSGRNGSAVLRLGGALVGSGWEEATIAEARARIAGPDFEAGIGEGARDNTGFRVAAWLRREMAFDYDLTRALLDEWNERQCSPMLPAADLDRLARQGESSGRAMKGSGNFEVLGAGSAGPAAHAEEVVGREKFQVTEAVMLEWERQMALLRAAGAAGAAGAMRGPANGLDTEHAGALDEENVSWLIENVIAKGKLNVLLGEGGKGKSQLTLAIAAAVTRGLPMGAPLGAAGAEGVQRLAQSPYGAAPERGDVLLIADEDGWRDTVKPRLQSAGALRTSVHRLKSAFRWDKAGGKDKTGGWVIEPFALETDMAALGRWISLNPSVRLIVIDPLNAYFGEKADSYKAADVRRVLRPFKTLAEEAGVAILAIMHPNKRQEGDVASWISGSAAVAQYARLVWALLDDPEDGEWKAAGRHNRRQVLAWAKGNVGASYPQGLRLEVRGHEYMRGDGAMLIRSSHIVPLGPVRKLANDIVKELREEGAKASDGRRSENKGGEKEIAKQVIYDALARAIDCELAVSTLTQIVLSEALFSRRTYFRAKDDLVQAGQLIQHVNEMCVQMIRLADKCKPGMPGQLKFA